MDHRLDVRPAAADARVDEALTSRLPPDEYPKALAAADLGLCLHRSASGLDLPMKIADLFGAGLPICALDYGPWLAEVLRHGENGLVVTTSEELSERIVTLVDGYPDDAPLLERLRRGAEGAEAARWGAGWTTEAQPVLWPAESPG